MEQSQILIYLPIIVSIISIAISGITLYMSQFRKPSFKISMGPDIHIYHPKNGGTAIYLPVVITNKSPTRGIIEDIYLRIKTPEDKFFSMKWLEEGSIKYRDWDYNNIDRARPIVVDGYQSVSKVLWFNWYDSTHELLFRKGAHDITILAYKEKGTEPVTIKTQKIFISDITEQELVKRKKEKSPKSRIHSFIEESKILQWSEKDDLSIIGK